MCSTALFRFASGAEIYVESVGEFRAAFKCEPRFRNGYQGAASVPWLLGDAGSCCCPIDWDRTVPLLGFAPAGDTDAFIEIYDQVRA